MLAQGRASASVCGALNARFDWSLHAPATFSVGGGTFPRQPTVLYRSIPNGSPQFSIRRFLSSVFMDEHDHLGSQAFDELTEYLLGRRAAFSAPVRSELELALGALPGAPDPVQLAKRCAAELPTLGRSEARELADRVIQSLLVGVARSGRFASRYQDYRSKEYQDWTRLLVFASAYAELSSNFGGLGFYFAPSTDRPVFDLNAWNYAKDKARCWVHSPYDAGEFVTISSIRSDQIGGMIVRERPDGGREDNPVKYVLKKIRTATGKPALAVYDGLGAPCVAADEAGVPYPCRSRLEALKADIPLPFSEATRSRLPLMGVLRECDLAAPCEELRIPAREVPFSEISHRALRGYARDAVSSFSSGGSKRIALLDCAPDPADLDSVSCAEGLAPRFEEVPLFNLIGLDYAWFATNEIESCRLRCLSEEACRAYTFVYAGTQPEVFGKSAGCWLKTGIPAQGLQRRSRTATSGYKVLPKEP
jgi:hypothetical protein